MRDETLRGQTGLRAPVPYSDDLESVSPDEVETIRGLSEALTEIMETVAEDEGHARRSVHAKSHGVLGATLTVLPNLLPELAQGIFARSGEHPALLRISTNPGDMLDDSISLPRGVALKVLDVEGERLPGSEGARTQDFLMVNAPAFAAPTPEAFLKNLRLLAKTTDRAEWAKKALSAVFRRAEKTLEFVGAQSAALKTLGGAPNVHPLGETYFTQTPYRHGGYVAKYSLKPISPSLTRLTGTEVETAGRPNGIREEVDRAARAAPMEWELRAQLCRDLEAMPIEDPTVEWDEKESPFIPVARLRAEPQPAGADPRISEVDDERRFSPWIGVEAHRPLGAINRARRATYEMSAAFRSRVNRCPVHEPTTAKLPH
jgi:hypothetical protein